LINDDLSFTHSFVIPG